MSKYLYILRHPIDHAMLYVARRPKLKRLLRPIFARVPSIYGWLLGKRKLQLRTQLAFTVQEPHIGPTGSDSYSEFKYSMEGERRHTDEILQSIRQELQRGKGNSNAS